MLEYLKIGKFKSDSGHGPEASKQGTAQKLFKAGHGPEAAIQVMCGCLPASDSIGSWELLEAHRKELIHAPAGSEASLRNLSTMFNSFGCQGYKYSITCVCFPETAQLTHSSF